MKKFLSCYKPYLGLLPSVIFCALIIAGITLILPLGARYITKHIVVSHAVRNIVFLIQARGRHDFETALAPKIVDVLKKLWVSLAGKVLEESGKR